VDQDPEAPKPEHAPQGGERPSQPGLRPANFTKAFPIEQEAGFADEMHREKRAQARREDEQDVERDRRGFRGQHLPGIDAEGEKRREEEGRSAPKIALADRAFQGFAGFMVSTIGRRDRRFSGPELS